MFTQFYPDEVIFHMFYNDHTFSYAFIYVQCYSTTSTFCSFVNGLPVLITCNSSLFPDSGVGDPIHSGIRYQCPIYDLLDCRKPTGKCFIRRLWKYDDGDYDSYRARQAKEDWNIHLKGDNLNITTERLTDIILKTQ
jgi:hypothetical protein